MNAPYTPDVVMGSLGDSIHDFGSVQHNTLQIPAPPSGIAEWPFVGEKVHGLVASPCGPAGSTSEHAAKAWRAVEAGAGDGCQHRRLGTAVPVLVHHRRDHHGLRTVGDPKHHVHLRSHCRHWTGRRICKTFHGDHSCSGARCHRGRFHPVHRRWLGIDDRWRSVCRGARHGRSRAGIAQVPALLVTVPVIVCIWASGATAPCLRSSTPYCCFWLAGSTTY